MKPSKEELKKEIEKFENVLVDGIKTGFDKFKEVTPVGVFLVYKDNEFVPTMVKGLSRLFVDDESKNVAAEVLKVTAAQLKPVCMALVTEGYMVTKDIDKVANYTGRPSTDPDRKEVVMINLETPTHTKLITYIIDRSNKEPILVEGDSIPWQHKSTQRDNSSRFSNILKENYEDSMVPDLNNVTLQN